MTLQEVHQGEHRDRKRQSMQLPAHIQINASSHPLLHYPEMRFVFNKKQQDGNPSKQTL